MSALNFKKEFAQPVRNGLKRQTVRATRKHPIKQGERLYLYTGMRTKKCCFLLASTCTRVQRVEMQISLRMGFDMWLDGVKVADGELAPFAKADGFLCAADFMAFFMTHHGLALGKPFIGQVIYW